MSEIKYVLIEMIENDMYKMSGDSIIAGLFKGTRVYQPPKEDMLVLIENKKEDAIHLLNVAKYNILSLQKFDGYTKIIHCFRATEEDQKLALSIISDIIKELDDAGRTIDSDDNIIDIDTYTSIPEDVTIIKQSTSAMSSIKRSDAAKTGTKHVATINRDP